MTTPATNNTTDPWASVQNDKRYDQIPVVSFVTNAVDLGEKMKMAWNRAYPPKVAATPPVKAPSLDQQHYYRYLQEKSVFRCVVAMVPVLGNLCIWLYEKWSTDYGDFDKMYNLIYQQETNSGIVDAFKKASLELRCNQKFINVVEAQLVVITQIQSLQSCPARDEAAVINFTDLLTYAGDEVVFSPQIMNHDNFAAAVKHNKDFLKYEALGEQYGKEDIYNDFCFALCKEHPMEFVKVDPAMPAYSALAASCITKDPKIWTEFAEKHVLDLRDTDGHDSDCLRGISKILTEKLKNGEDITPWVWGLFHLRVGTSKRSDVFFIHDEGLIRASAKGWPLLVDYRLYECARKLNVPLTNWPQDPAFMSSLVNSASLDRNVYFLARYCDFDVLGLPECPIRKNLVTALAKLRDRKLLPEKELSPRLCTDRFKAEYLGKK